jgi:hypothetical protein
MEVLVKPIYSYVIRIYRRDGEALAGLVEDVRTSRTAPFQSLAELCEVLSARRPFARRLQRRFGAIGTELPRK